MNCDTNDVIMVKKNVLSGWKEKQAENRSTKKQVRKQLVTCSNQNKPTLARILHFLSLPYAIGEIALSSFKRNQPPWRLVSFFCTPPLSKVCQPLDGFPTQSLKNVVFSNNSPAGFPILLSIPWVHIHRHRDCLLLNGNTKNPLCKAMTNLQGSRCLFRDRCGREWPFLPNIRLWSCRWKWYFHPAGLC